LPCVGNHFPLGPLSLGTTMYLLYLDDSGTIGDPQTAHCLFAGFAVYETLTYWIEQEINAIALKYSLPLNMEFDASHINSGKKAWRKIPKNTRQALLFDLCYVIKNRSKDLRLFSSIQNIARSQYERNDINTDLFAQVASRFDMLLRRIYRKTAKRERGIIIFDKSKSELYYSEYVA